MRMTPAIAAALVSMLLCVAPRSPGAAPSSYSAPVLFDGIERQSMHVESYDGTRIAVSVLRPSTGGVVTNEKLPVIFTQQRIEGPQARYFVERGYVWVGQDRRGVGASFGQ
jgi:uncharacterized protein